MNLHSSHRLPTNPHTTPLAPPLRAIGRRLRLRDSLLFVTRTLWLGLAGAGIVLIAGRLWPIEHLWWWASVPLLIWLIAVMGYALIRPLPPLSVARRADLMLRLKERLSTALELAMQSAQAPSRAGRGSELVERQWDDALSVAREINPRKDIRLAVDRRALRWAGLAAAAVAILLVLPNPMDAVLEHRAAVRQAAQEQARQVEELREALRQETTPTSEEREEVLRRLAELARELRENRGDEQQALADISQAEEALRQLLDPQAGTKRAALQSLAEQLAGLATRQTGQPPESARDALNQLAEALAGLDPSQQADLAGQLDQLAAQVATTDMNLADALSTLAEAARRGDLQAAERAAQSAQAALINAERDQDLQRAIARALAELQDSRTAVARAGQSRGGQQQAQGQGQGQGSSQSQNPGPGQGQGQPGRGGGTNARQLPPASRVGRAGDPTGPPRQPEVGELNQVYAPRTPGEAGDIDFIQGQQGVEGQTQSRQERQPLPGSAGRSTVPYSEVFPAYREAAGAALEREYIPPGLREYVKEYFSRLDPGAEP
jgi:hypothetical protein